MLNIDPKKKNKYYSIFSIGSKKFGYGSYNRAKNLISIIKDKKIQINQFYFEKNYKIISFSNNFSDLLNKSI